LPFAAIYVEDPIKWQFSRSAFLRKQYSGAMSFLWIRHEMSSNDSIEFTVKGRGKRIKIAHELVWEIIRRKAASLDLQRKSDETAQSCMPQNKTPAQESDETTE
jgi:hypothetical protein